MLDCRVLQGRLDGEQVSLEQLVEGAHANLLVGLQEQHEKKARKDPPPTDLRLLPYGEGSALVAAYFRKIDLDGLTICAGSYGGALTSAALDVLKARARVIVGKA